MVKKEPKKVVTHENAEMSVATGLLNLAREQQTSNAPVDKRSLENAIAEAVDVLADHVPEVAMSAVSVSIKTKRRVRSPRIRIGDVFIGLIEGQSFYGRVLVENQLGTLLEFYDVPLQLRLAFSEVMAMKPEPVLYRYVFSSAVFSSTNFRVIGNFPVPRTYPLPYFFLGGGNLHHPVRARLRKLTEDDVLQLEPTITYSSEGLIEGLRDHGLHEVWPDTVESRSNVLERMKEFADWPSRKSKKRR